MPAQRFSWYRTALQLKGSVIPAIIGRTVLCGLFGVFVSVLDGQGVSVAMPALASLIPNIVLGLLLVFRTNTAYERFWEGRKLWGAIVNTSRNLARSLWILIPAKDEGDRTEKIAALHLIVAFAVATKLHLRQEPINTELESLLSPAQFEHLQHINHPPMHVAFWLGDYAHQHYTLERIDSVQLSAIQTFINQLVDCLGGCERILKTPIPLAYAIHLKQLLLLYCLSLPFQMVGNVHVWTGPVVALISFTLFGIEAIGIEIENPFGRDPNDLPLDAICATMLRNIDELTTLTPCSQY
jgi:ion channel-forming bestrophin family protein